MSDEYSNVARCGDERKYKDTMSTRSRPTLVVQCSCGHEEPCEPRQGRKTHSAHVARQVDGLNRQLVARIRELEDQIIKAGEQAEWALREAMRSAKVRELIEELGGQL